VSDLNLDLSTRYGVPIDFQRKMSGLAAVCRALNRGDVIHAQIVTLHLQIPDPPKLEKSGQVAGAVPDLARALRASDLLKEEWDEDKHPRWPAGSPESVGGQFAPAGAVGESTAEQNAPITTAQAGAMPIPFEWQIPIPPRFPPVPLAPPDISPRDLPKNPYPDRPECEQQWAEAYRYCQGLVEKELMGKDGYRGMGKFLYQCILGQVSEDCGGSPKSRGYPNAET
jgi:hypothetical protein